jgi:hypothetical protein
MSRTKALISILMILILIALSGASVWAAPNLQESISGEVQEIVIEVDEETETTTVLVTLLVDETTGETQTVRLSLETAIELGLVEVDENGDPVLDDDGNPIPILIDPDDPPTVTIDLSDVIEEDEEEGEEGVHPVASALAEFFAATLGLDYNTVMGYHEEGMGFGVIAQACWISFALESDATLLGDILAAKKSGDFSSITLTDGTTAKNWGQFKKAALGSEKAKKNLGAIMSGRANHEQEQEEEEEMSATGLSGKGKDKGGKPDTPPGQLKNKKDKDKGGGPPAEPPGQVKNKDKGGGKKE